VYSDPKLLLSALAYVPVSAALTFCYEQTRSIWPPVFFHMFVNALSLTVLAG
jgi:membrane protease YdiL (CAAX protease family)